MNFSMGKFLLSVALGLMLSSSAMALPQVRIIATGGTIAGVGQSATESTYQAGEVGINSLIAAVPQMTKLADIQGEQLVKIGSQDMNDDVWLALAKRINILLADKNIDGIVITHGTDTLEETAYFLNLTVKSDKPVVLVGAMRPSTAMSADGPMNLYNAVAIAADLNAKGRGVLVVMNDTVLNARDVTKTNTTGVHTFAAPNLGPLGVIHNSKVEYMGRTERQHTNQTPFDISKLNKLPRVGIIYNYANASDLPAKSMVEAGFDGIVSAGVGNGNMYHTVFDTLAKASKDGVLIVRSSRVPTGATTLDAEIDDTKYGFVAAGNLNPQKARILLMLSLTKSQDPKQIQQWFQQF
ncbi:L-asparaginase 2 [Shewanella sp. SR44-3]|uniref:L-asparaginase 2 n=1 Tax=Shewanella sp. SR44-3 TaxID=2760936 RepID=UPI0015FC7FCA|nr:L-asparaginase 2 [Shewanella sp. SR44-3]MBB1269522.1 L-asparaginase 2 [Shewanella sp. SR44-3]